MRYRVEPVETHKRRFRCLTGRTWNETTIFLVRYYTRLSWTIFFSWKTARQYEVKIIVITWIEFNIKYKKTLSILLWLAYRCLTWLRHIRRDVDKNTVVIYHRGIRVRQTLRSATGPIAGPLPWPWLKLNRWITIMRCINYIILQ